MKINLSKIKETQPLREHGNIKEFADNIQKEGLLQPLVINQNDELVCGRRRLEAIKLLGWEEVEVYCINTDDDIDKLSKAIAENVMRKQLAWQEEVKANEELEQLRIAKYGKPTTCPTGGQASIRAIAKETKQSKSTVANNLQLAKALKKYPKLEKIKTKQGALRELKLIKQKERLKKNPPETPKGLYDVIVIDPPWEMEGKYNPQGRRGIPPYLTMNIEQIKTIKLPANKDCILWLWVTNRKMKYAFEILETWGFEERNILTWVKDTFGVGDWLRGQTEHCILAIKGKPIFDGKSTTTVLYGKRTKHSKKPDKFYQLVKKTCFGRKIDYFATEKRKGWDVFGDEVKY